MSNLAPLCEMLEAFRERSIACSVGPTGALRVQPRGALTPAERGWLRTHAGAMVEFLSAIGDMHETDTAVAASGVSGFHPEIQRAADEVIAAYRAHDLPRVRLACQAMRGCMVDAVAPMLDPVPVEIEVTVGRTWAGADKPDVTPTKEPTPPHD